MTINLAPNDAATINEPGGLTAALDTTTRTTVARLTRTQIITADGRRFNRATGREIGRRALWGRTATIAPTPTPADTVTPTLQDCQDAENTRAAADPFEAEDLRETSTALWNARTQALTDLAPQVTPEHDLGPEFDAAVRNALGQITVAERGMHQQVPAWTDIPEDLRGFLIVRADPSEGVATPFMVRHADAFAPEGGGLLLSLRPQGTPVARVTLDAVVTLL